MNKQQRKEWDNLVDDCSKQISDDWGVQYDKLVILANSYILKLERELQNIKGGRKVAAVLKAKVES